MGMSPLVAFLAMSCLCQTKALFENVYSQDLGASDSYKCLSQSGVVSRYAWVNISALHLCRHNSSYNKRNKQGIRNLVVISRMVIMQMNLASPFTFVVSKMGRHAAFAFVKLYCLCIGEGYGTARPTLSWKRKMLHTESTSGKQSGGNFCSRAQQPESIITTNLMSAGSMYRVQSSLADFVRESARYGPLERKSLQTVLDCLLGKPKHFQPHCHWSQITHFYNPTSHWSKSNCQPHTDRWKEVEIPRTAILFGNNS